MKLKAALFFATLLASMSATATTVGLTVDGVTTIYNLTRLDYNSKHIAITATRAEIGTCGPAANVATSVPPPSGRCAAGSTAGPIVTTTTLYSWTCAGSKSTASCSAPRK